MNKRAEEENIGKCFFLFWIRIPVIIFNEQRHMIIVDFIYACIMKYPIPLKRIEIFFLACLVSNYTHSLFIYCFEGVIFVI